MPTVLDVVVRLEVVPIVSHFSSPEGWPFSTVLEARWRSSMESVRRSLRVLAPKSRSRTFQKPKGAAIWRAIRCSARVSRCLRSGPRTWSIGVDTRGGEGDSACRIASTAPPAKNGRPSEESVPEHATLTPPPADLGPVGSGWTTPRAPHPPCGSGPCPHRARGSGRGRRARCW